MLPGRQRFASPVLESSLAGAPDGINHIVNANDRLACST